MNIRPYVSVDIETTSLDLERSDILELGFVYDDGVSPIEKLIKRNFILKLPSISFATFSALNLNIRLIKTIHEGTHADLVTIEQAFDSFIDVLIQASTDARDYDKKRDMKPSSRVSLAGKNVSAFDIPIIKSFLLRQGLEHLWTSIEALKQHRTIDPGSMYFHDYGYVPSLGEIMLRINPESTGISHVAMEDSLDVVKAIRFKR